LQRGLSLRDYGLAMPWVRWQATDGAGTYELWVGHEAPLGEAVYVMLAGSPEIIATDPSVRDLVPGSDAMLRDPHLLAGSADRVTRIELHRAGHGFLRLQRQDGRWFLQQPVNDRADAGMVQGLLDELFAVRAETFEWDPGGSTNAAVVPAADPDARLEAYGLADDEASARILVRLDGDLVSYELDVGKVADVAAGTLYARRRDLDSIFTIRAAGLGWLTVELDELRDRDVFARPAPDVERASLRRGEHRLELERDATNRWRVVTPVQWRADQQAVSEMVTGLSKWRTLSFLDGGTAPEAARALLTPFCIVTLTGRSPLPAAVPTELALGASPLEDAPLWVGVVTGETAAVYARFEGETTIRRLPASALSVLGDDPLNPLLYRDRTVLAIPPSDVQRITLTKGGRLSEVVRTAGGNWQPAGTMTNAAVAQDVVNDVLYFISNLRALRADVHNPEALAPYGLDPGVCTLTLGLMGSTGIQKTLVIGSEAHAEAVYTMVKGQDVVFVVSAAITDMLARDPLVPLP
jgi:hypothetical protein